MKLPESLLITTPHSSHDFPEEVLQSVALNLHERREGCDFGTKEVALAKAFNRIIDEILTNTFPQY